ncbi:MAG: DUF2730 family protein [Rhizomicrobium sp.]
MNADTISNLIQAGLAILSVAALGFGFYVRSTARKQIDEAIAPINETLGEHHDRLVKLEAHWETLPTRDDFHKMAVQFTEVVGEMKAIKARMEAIGDTVKATQSSVQRVNDYLLNEKVG